MHGHYRYNTVHSICKPKPGNTPNPSRLLLKNGALQIVKLVANLELPFVHRAVRLGQRGKTHSGITRAWLVLTFLCPVGRLN